MTANASSILLKSWRNSSVEWLTEFVRFSVSSLPLSVTELSQLDGVCKVLRQLSAALSDGVQPAADCIGDSRRLLGF